MTIGEAKSYEMDITIKVDDCEGNQSMGYKVAGNTIKGVMEVTNLGAHDYVDDITCLLYYNGNDGYMYLTNSSIIPAE